MRAARTGWLLALATAQASCAAATNVGPPAPPGPPPPAAPAHLEIVPVYGTPFCASPYPLAEVRPLLAQGASRTWMTERWDTAWRPLFGARASFGQLSPDLKYLPPIDVLPFMGKELVVEVALYANPALTAQLTVAPQYGCQQVMNLSGRSGRNGWDSLPGQHGEPGPHVRLAVGYVTDPSGEPLVLVRVDEGSVMRGRTLFAPGGSPLQVVLDGGAGGLGGPGRELYVGIGMPVGHLPRGRDGDGGDGGTAFIAFDQAFPDLERKIVVLNRGGSGGGSGIPGRPGPVASTARLPAARLFGDEIAHGVSIRRRSTARTAGSSR